MVTLTPEEMDQAAELFNAELQKLPQTITVPFARLWKAYYMKAGHKRLGRIMVALAKATDKMKDKDFTTAEDMIETKQYTKKAKPAKKAKPDVKANATGQFYDPIAKKVVKVKAKKAVKK
jgi:hypothetical protein